mgnify:CR=1 FL=1
MNIAEILKYCPKGTKLYSTIFGEVELIQANKQSLISISVKSKDRHLIGLYSDGRFSSEGECVLFPSKDQRDWKKFRLPVKRGDIMMSSTTKRAFIASGGTINCHPEYICGINAFDAFQIVGDHGDSTIWTSDFCIPASEEAKEELFDEMTEAGYKWNADTLELEKIEPKFKEGDVVIDNQGNVCLVSKIRDDGFMTIVAVLYRNNVLNVYTSNTVNRNIQLTTIASTTDRNKLYSALVRKGYKYDKEQHLLIKQEFKPFDKVLVRDDPNQKWTVDMFSYYNREDNDYPYICVGNHYCHCLPYNEQTAHLVGTKEFYNP